MDIPSAHQHRCVFHFSHIANLPGILQNGFLAKNHAQFPDINTSIASNSIQRRRSRMQVTCGPGGCVHDYVPLYFGSVSPMLLGVINAKNVDQCDILYFEFPIKLVAQPDVVFTSASANTEVPPDFHHAPTDLTKLDWNAIDSRKWGNVDDSFRHRRMAEVLVHQRLSVEDAIRCVVWNEEVKKSVEAIVGDRPFPSIEFQDRNRPHWFTNFATGGSSSIVTGPGEIDRIFNAACSHVEAQAGKHNGAAQYASLTDLKIGLRRNFGCISHTAELVGLRSENGLHKKPVDLHTQDVVAKLLVLDEFKALSPLHQELTEIAAYLHDIGKGPRSRWDGNGGLQKVDPNHPVGAMPMMADILSNHVAQVDQSSARIVMKLTCYHDLVGDVLGQGRDQQQIVDVADNVDELSMLFAIARADVTSLVEWWWDVEKASALFERCAAAINGGKGRRYA